MSECKCTGEWHVIQEKCPDPRVVSCEFIGRHSSHDYMPDIGISFHCPGARPAETVNKEVSW